MYVCSNCFNDIELKSYINSFSKRFGDCLYCKSSPVSLLAVEELLDFFVELLDVFQPKVDGIELKKILQEDWNLFTSESIANEILNGILSKIDHPINDAAHKVGYIQDIADNIFYWATLKEDLKWDRRYLLKLNNIEDLGWDRFFSDTVRFNEGDRFFRARIHHNEDEPTLPVVKMGSPPREKAEAGRANPQGIPYLYLSKSIKTTLFEARALFRDEISVGEFEIMDGNSIDLVDFTEIASAFVGLGDLVEYTKKIQLKRLISKDLSKPIRRYDSDIEYIPTQFICEYLRYIIGAEGILFNSSLDLEGQNIVLFNQDKVECLNVKKHIITKLDIEHDEV